jgi:hypothetical protein
MKEPGSGQNLVTAFKIVLAVMHNIENINQNLFGNHPIAAHYFVWVKSFVLYTPMWGSRVKSVGCYLSRWYSDSLVRSFLCGKEKAM